MNENAGVNKKINPMEVSRVGDEKYLSESARNAWFFSSDTQEEKEEHSLVHYAACKRGDLVIELNFPAAVFEKCFLE